MDGIVKPLKVQEVSKNDLEEYKGRLANRLLKYGFDTNKLAVDNDMKTFIENYVTTNIIDRTAKDAIVGISKKLAHMDIGVSGIGTLTFPVIHTYKYHNLVNTIIFYRNENNDPVAEEVPLMDEKLIIV